MKKEDRKREFDFSAAAAAVRAERAQKDFIFPQWSGINPVDVGLYLTAHERGEYYDSAPILEAVLKYDAHIATCFEKRVAGAISGAWEIALEKTDEALKPEAEKQARILRDFFNTVSVSSALARDAQLSVGSLLRHILSSIAFGYSAAAASYYPAKTPEGDDTVHASFITCPLRFFEARDRFLRIRTQLGEIDGKPLDPRKWIVANSLNTPLLVPSLIAFCLKSTPMEDWAHVVEKFGIPFLYVNTPAKEGSPEWEAAKKAVREIGSGFSGVLGENVKLTTNTLAQGDAPHERIIDYLDRQISRLWLGSDLAVMSREGDAVGSMVQGDAISTTAKLDRDFIEQIVDQQVVRRVLDLVFGKGTRQLAYFKFSTSRGVDVSALAQKMQIAREYQLPIPKAWIYAEIGVPEPQDGEETVSAAAVSTGMPIAGAKTGEFGLETLNKALDTSNAAISPKIADSIAAAQNDAFAELLDALDALERATDFPAALAEFNKKFPEYAGRILEKTDVGDAIADEILKHSNK